MTRERRRYSDNDRATALAALDACAGNASEAARVTGVPRKTLEEWDAGRVADGVAELRQEKKAELSELFEDIARDILQAAPKKIDDASLKDAMVAAGVAVDKMQLLKGKPTEITESRADPATTAARISELLVAGRDRASLPQPDARGAGGGRPAPGGAAVH